MLAKRKGMAIRFHESEVRAMGRTAYGVKAMTLEEDDEVVGMVARASARPRCSRSPRTATASAREIAEYRVSAPRRQGHHHIKTTERNGKVVGGARRSSTATS